MTAPIGLSVLAIAIVGVVLVAGREWGNGVPWAVPIVAAVTIGSLSRGNRTTD
ncbi:MAG: hypothetical protein ABIZ07_12840 [Dermatophilaceae bacterium]